MEINNDGNFSYLDGNLFDVKTVAISSTRKLNSNWLYIDSGARVNNSTSNAKGNTYKGNLRVLNLRDYSGSAA